jgi:hypothetical protein
MQAPNYFLVPFESDVSLDLLPYIDLSDHDAFQCVVEVDGNHFVRVTNHMPAQWVSDGLSCLNCIAYCCWNGVFVGYCSACAAEFNNERGFGFSGNGPETGEHALPDAVTSMGNTYLRNVLLDDIGNPAIYDSHNNQEQLFNGVKRSMHDLCNPHDEDSIYQATMWIASVTNNNDVAPAEGQLDGEIDDVETDGESDGDEPDGNESDGDE